MGDNSNALFRPSHEPLHEAHATGLNLSLFFSEIWPPQLIFFCFNLQWGSRVSGPHWCKHYGFMLLLPGTFLMSATARMLLALSTGCPVMTEANTQTVVQHWVNHHERCDTVTI